MVDGSGGSGDRSTRLRAGIAARLLAATLAGVADALDDRVHEREPEVQDLPEPSDDRWLLLLDREDPSRSLIIVPHRVVSACRARDAAARGAASGGASIATAHARGHRRRWAAWRATVRRRWTTSAPTS
jgi:hypothetical protein